MARQRFVRVVRFNRGGQNMLKHVQTRVIFHDLTTNTFYHVPKRTSIVQIE